MVRHQRSERLFAIGLSGLGGFVDAVGFIALGGFFVSFLSGNSTRLAVGLAGNFMNAAIAGGLSGPDRPLCRICLAKPPSRSHLRPPQRRNVT